jgi:hypothetical protein
VAKKWFASWRSNGRKVQSSSALPTVSQKELRARFFTNLAGIYYSLVKFTATISEKYIQEVFSPVKREIALNGDVTNTKKLGICVARLEKKLIQASKGFNPETRNNLINESLEILSDVTRLEKMLGGPTDWENSLKEINRALAIFRQNGNSVGSTEEQQKYIKVSFGKSAKENNGRGGFIKSVLSFPRKILK